MSKEEKDLCTEEVEKKETPEEPETAAEPEAEDPGESEAPKDDAPVEEAPAGETTEEEEASQEEGTEEEPAAAAEDEEPIREKYLRLMADFQNYKRRVEREKKDLYSYANEKIMGDLLEVLDNFERALGQDTAAAADDGGAGFMEGMEMIFKQLTDVLKKEGLEEINALGEEFDPNLHNAVMTEETEEYESGKVSGVMQKGYTLKGKVIRPSMVKVAN